MPPKAFAWKGNELMCPGHLEISRLFGEVKEGQVSFALGKTLWDVFSRCVCNVLLSLLLLHVCFSEDLYLSSSVKTKH